MKDGNSILFVDDDRNILKALRRLLEDETYKVRTCDDPDEAVRQIQAEEPTVVVSDFYMPRMNGPALLKKVREVNPFIVRIVLTGKPDVGAVLEAMKQCSAWRFLLKPWDEDELKMTLLQAIDHRGILEERDALLREVERNRRTMEGLEGRYPGISNVLRVDSRGEIVVGPRDVSRKG